MSRRTIQLLFAAALLAFVAGCGGGGAPEQETADQAEPELDPATFGQVTLTVNYEGDQPEGKEVYSGANPECRTETIMQYPVYVNDNGTLRNVVLSVEEGPSGLDETAEADTMPVVDQDHCEYQPHVFAVEAEQTFKVINSDPGMHNVRATVDSKQLFNKTTMEGESFEETFEDPGVYSLVCNIHPWMQNWTYVTEHGHAAVTDDQGSATLQNLPPGDYTLTIWHEKLGAKTREITLEDQAEESISVTYSG